MKNHVSTEKKDVPGNLVLTPQSHFRIVFNLEMPITLVVYRTHNIEIVSKLKVGARRNIFLQTLLDTRASYISNFCCSKLILKDSKGKIIRPRLPLQVLFSLTVSDSQAKSCFLDFNPCYLVSRN